VRLQAAVSAAAAGDAARAARGLRLAERALREAGPVSELLATMRPEAFLTFLEHTDVASAIRSRSYTTVESLCRRADPEAAEEIRSAMAALLVPCVAHEATRLAA
jgi:tryptophan 2,3-dioxygenase